MSKDVIIIGTGFCALGIFAAVVILLEPLFSEASTGYNVDVPFLLLMLFFPVVGFFLAFPNWKRRQQTFQLLENGSVVSGTVTDVDRKKSTTRVGSKRRSGKKLRKHVISATIQTEQGPRNVSFVTYKRTGGKLARLAMEQGTPLVFLFDENHPTTAIPPVLMLANSVIRPAVDAGTLQDVTLRA